MTARTTPPAWVDRQAYPFTSRWHEIRPGVHMHYVDEGEGPVLLFVHGTPTWSFEWRHLIRALSTSHRCVAVDLLGMGLSDRPADFSYTPEAHADALRAFVSAAKLEAFTLVLHDFGGPIGLPLALEGSIRVERLVLFNTWAWPFDDDPGMRRRARLAGTAAFRFLYAYLNFSLRVLMPSAYADRARLTPAIHGQYLAVFPDPASRVRVLWAFARALLGSSAFYRGIADALPRIRSLPSLIVWGRRDTAFQPYLLERWRRELPAARTVELDAGHWPHEERPEEVVAVLREFLSAAPSPVSTPSLAVPPVPHPQTA